MLSAIVFLFRKELKLIVFASIFSFIYGVRLVTREKKKNAVIT